MNFVLGKSAAIPKSYAPQILCPVERALGRKDLGAAKFYGVDHWNCYELAWLNPNGEVRQAVLTFQVSSNSKAIIESKSLKLYLASFTFEKLDQDKLVETIAHDLANCVGQSLLSLNLTDLDSSTLNPNTAPGRSLEESARSFALQDRGQDQVHLVHWHGYRSLCPITSQPDWATVLIMHQGGEINYSALLQDLNEKRDLQAFHEACCEKLLEDLLLKFSPKRLALLCCFTRRGGIDINPMRTTHQDFIIPYKRLLRQ